jgi:hypothetical protein
MSPGLGCPPVFNLIVLYINRIRNTDHRTAIGQKKAFPPLIGFH